MQHDVEDFGVLQPRPSRAQQIGRQGIYVLPTARSRDVGAVCSVTAGRREIPFATLSAIQDQVA